MVTAPMHMYIQAGTARVIWSYHSSDPASESAFSRHEAQGSISLNLLAGLTEDRVEPEDAMEFPITVGNVNYSCYKWRIIAR